MNETTPARPSITCLYVAAGRALGAREPDETVRNPDYLAERLLGPAERALVADQAAVQALYHDYAEAIKNPEVVGSVIMMLIRTRYIEERLEHAIGAGALQVVILGAGFDTRAYRLTDLLKHVHVYEVDQPSTQEYKRRRVVEEGIEIPPNLTYVPVDFRHEDLGEKLREAGFDSSRITFVIWEGVTMYLPEASVDQTLAWVASLAPGSAVIFDFVNRSALQFLATVQLDKLPELAKQAVLRLQRLEAGEPWLFGIPDGEEQAFLEKHGLRVAELLPLGGEPVKRFLIRKDGSPYIPIPQLPRQGQPAHRATYCIAEAVVPLQ
jgi:methyltransferase (TIGR00027 family)